MRILMVSKACIVGAYQTKLEELARLPAVDLTVAVPPYWRDRSGTLELERRHVAGYELVVEPMALSGNYHLHVYPGLGRLVGRVRPELVHIDEEPYNLCTAHALWLARRAGARTVFFSWQNIMRRYPLPFRMMERYVLSHADHGIVGNQESVSVWRAKGYAGPLTVIPQFGIDPQLFAPGHREPRQQLEVAYIGRLVEEKGVDLLLDALEGLEGEWRASILGRGPEREALQAQAALLGIDDRVTFLDHVPSMEMPSHYRHLDIVVLPSRTRTNWKEQFGRVLVEAMACGVPVIGSDSGEIPHVIGDAGLIFPEGRARQLRDCLSRLMGAPELRADLSRRGRERVLACYTQEEIAAETYHVYQEALGS